MAGEFGLGKGSRSSDQSAADPPATREIAHHHNGPLKMHSLPSSISLALALGTSLSAQGPSNDDCSNATALTPGVSVRGDNRLGTLNAQDPAWSCGVNITSDVWFRYTATQDCGLNISTCGSTGSLADTAVEVFAGCPTMTDSPVTCNDDGCAIGFLSNADWSATSGTTYFIRVGGWGAGQGTFDITLRAGALQITGAVNNAPMDLVGSTFTDGDILKYNYVECSTGKLTVSVWNLQAGGPPALGYSNAIPGFRQLWPGSAPAGVGLLGPLAFLPLPTPHTVAVPSGIFSAGDTIRMQALMLDPEHAMGSLPVVPSVNTVLFTYTPGACIAGTVEDFEAVTGLGSYPPGWTDGGGDHQWQAHSSNTPSGGTGPLAAFSGSRYFYCEASSPAHQSETYVLNSPTYSTASSPHGIQFALSRVGATIGTLEVKMADMSAASPTYDIPLGTFSGPGTNEWDHLVVPFPANTPANISIQFAYSRGLSFTGDLALDAFCILQ